MISEVKSILGQIPNIMSPLETGIVNIAIWILEQLPTQSSATNIRYLHEIFHFI
jgi:hypothetical protein